MQSKLIDRTRNAQRDQCTNTNNRSVIKLCHSVVNAEELVGTVLDIVTHKILYFAMRCVFSQQFLVSSTAFGEQAISFELFAPSEIGKTPINSLHTKVAVIPGFKHTKPIESCSIKLEME